MTAAVQCWVKIKQEVNQSRSEFCNVTSIKHTAVMKQYVAVLYIGTNKSEEYGASIFRAEQTLNIETAGSFEMLVPIYQSTRFQIPEDHELTARTNENFCFSRSRKRVHVISGMFLPEV